MLRPPNAQPDEQDAERLETLATLEASAKRGAAMVGRLLSFARGADGRRDAMPTGGQITLTAKNIVIDQADANLNIDAQSGPYVTLAVEDTGTGIPKGIIDKIFDPFFTTKEIGKGTGLGLATSLAIVTGHKGFMRVDGKRGAGTRFVVYLPAQTTWSKRASPVPAAAHPRGQGETVLVVDDEAGIRQIAKRTLEAFGYRVLLASGGAEAIALYVQRQADIPVVLTDMMMPMMDGIATIQALVRLDPEVHIIGASGLTTDAKAAGAAAARVMHFLAKPYTAETLLTAVRAALPPALGRESEG